MRQLKEQIRSQTLTALMAAIIFIVTWTLKIPISFLSGGAYVNLGDVCIYMCAFLLGGPKAALAAAIGSGAADLASGAVIYIAPTMLIKGIMGFAAAALMKKHGFKDYLAGSLVGGAIMVCGYALFEYFVWGMGYALTSLPFNCLQWAGSLIAAAVTYTIPKQIKVHLPGNGMKTTQ